MSVLGKKWFVLNQNGSKNPLDKILENRSLLNLNENGEFHDPFLFTDMEKAVTRLYQAIKSGERIIVFGDYDVDGISGTALAFQVLKKLGATVSYRLPHRMNDGYGLSEKFVKEFVDLGIKLVVTVDCGISNADLIDKLNENGIEVIITDHHTIPEKIPDAYAIIHPKKDEKYPFKELTGSAVAFKLAQGLIEKYWPEEEGRAYLNSLLDLATLGVIADLGPLLGENRTIVKRGLNILGQSKWAGLRKIVELAEIEDQSKIDPTTVGYRIAPRINAAGRIGDPYLALQLLLQDDSSEKLNSLGAELENLNKQRQKMTSDSLEEAEAYFLQDKEVPYLLMAESSSWHVGILGLVAGRLVEKYARPAVILQDFGDVLVGSARSPEFFNITEALAHFKHYLCTFGGHAQAAGFNIKKENLAAFKKDLLEYAREKLKDNDLMPTLNIDCELKDSDISFDFLNEIDKLAPFGIGNLAPTFVLKNIAPLLINQVGREKEHLKFSLQSPSHQFQVIGFRLGQFAEELKKHPSVNVVFKLNRNYWNNKEYIQLHALDLSFN